MTYSATSPRYGIGEQLFMATMTTEEYHVTCPDCGGCGHIRCLLHDDTMVTVDCRACQRGYDPPSGKIQAWRPTARVRRVTVTGVSMRPGGYEYEVTDGIRNNIVDEGDLLASESEAMARSDVLAAEYEAQQLAKIKNKEKDTRSWAWNVHYHREQIRKAEKDLAYHRSKLDVARVKAKEKKP